MKTTELKLLTPKRKGPKKMVQGRINVDLLAIVDKHRGEFNFSRQDLMEALFELFAAHMEKQIKKRTKKT